MTQFTKGKVSDMPARIGEKGALTVAMQALKDDEALFVPRKEDEVWLNVQRRVSAAVNGALGPGKALTRTDRAKDGVWIYLCRNGGSA